MEGARGQVEKRNNTHNWTGGNVQTLKNANKIKVCREYKVKKKHKHNKL